MENDEFRENTPYKKEDIGVEKTHSVFSSISTAVIGKGHIRQNIPCQDVALHYSGDDIGIAIVCDGAGSSKYGLEAAEETSNQVKEYFIKRQHGTKTASEIRDELCDTLIKSLSKLKKLYNCNIHDLYSTLLFGVLDRKTNEYIIGHIGDGLIVGFELRSMQIFSEPENGDRANETYFVAYTVDKKLRQKHFRIKRRPLGNVIGFALMSDGTAESYHIKNKSLNREGIFLAPDIMAYFENLDKYPVKTFAQQLHETLEKRVAINTDDDCSIALLKLNKPKLPLLISHTELVRTKEVAEKRIEKIDAQDAKVSQIETRLRNIETRLNALENEVTQKNTRIESQFNPIKTRLQNTEIQLHTLKNEVTQKNIRIESLETQVKTLKQQKPDDNFIKKAISKLLGLNRDMDVKAYISSLVKEEFKKNQALLDSRGKGSSHVTESRSNIAKEEINQNQAKLESVGKGSTQFTESIEPKEEQSEKGVRAPESIDELIGKYYAANSEDYLEIKQNYQKTFDVYLSIKINGQRSYIDPDKVKYQTIGENKASLKLICSDDKIKLYGTMTFLSDKSFKFLGYFYSNNNECINLDEICMKQV